MTSIVFIPRVIVFEGPLFSILTRFMRLPTLTPSTTVTLPAPALLQRETTAAMTLRSTETGGG